eukprot:8581914-Pyramimonas_sp.AAC.1
MAYDESPHARAAPLARQSARGGPGHDLLRSWPCWGDLRADRKRWRAGRGRGAGASRGRLGLASIRKR